MTKHSPHCPRIPALSSTLGNKLFCTLLSVFVCKRQQLFHHGVLPAALISWDVAFWPSAFRLRSYDSAFSVFRLRSYDSAVCVQMYNRYIIDIITLSLGNSASCWPSSSKRDRLCRNVSSKLIRRYDITLTKAPSIWGNARSFVQSLFITQALSVTSGKGIGW